MAPNPLVKAYFQILQEKGLEGPVLDLACGQGDNGLFLAGLGIPVILADRSAAALARAREKTAGQGWPVRFWEVDLETGVNPLEEETYRGILVFRYLHRPLMPCLKKAIRTRGVLIYETYTTAQARYGRPHNPAYLLKPGELLDWFKDWQVIHYFEGLLEDPTRAMAQIVCRKPDTDKAEET